MRRLALALLVLACLRTTACTEASPSARGPCPVAVRMGAGGAVWVSDCRAQIGLRAPADLRGAMARIWSEREQPLPPLPVDIDDAATLAQVQTLLNTLQDNGFYRYALADGPRAAPIRVDMMPPPMRFTGTVVFLRPDGRVDVIFRRFEPVAQGIPKLGAERSDAAGGQMMQDSPRPRSVTVTVSLADLSTALPPASQTRRVYVFADNQTPWRAMKPIYRALAATGHDQLIPWEVF